MPTKSEIPTPALLLDLDALEENLERMASRVKESGKKLRPHAKAHKCVEIAKRQIEAGACGLCVATVDEAELMATARMPGLLLTSPLGDSRKVARAAATEAMVAVDHLQQVEWYERAARETIDVLVDLDVGDHRTGACSIDQAMEIARAIDRAPHLRLRGLQAYSVDSSHAADLKERTRISQHAFEIAAQMRDAMAHEGFPIEIVSGGSTGTFAIDLAFEAVTEIQAGSYALMDLAYQRAGANFRHALTVLATVVSANHAGFVTVDAGFKAFSTDRGYGPEAASLPGSSYRWGGDEFGYVDVEKPLRLGDRIEFIPPHCDPTVNLYRKIHACRGETVEAVWPVMSL